MKRGFLKSNRKPLYGEFSGFAATHQAVWETLAQQGRVTKCLDITEALNKEDSTLADAEEGIIRGIGQTLSRPSFEDKTKSVLVPNLIHRIPSLATTQGREPSSFCLLWSSSLEKITNAAGYPSSLPKTRLPSLITIKSAPNMGLGVFAKHNIKASELVLAERPLLIVPPVIPVVGDRLDLSAEEIRRTGTEAYEESLEEFLNMMRREEADAFRNLGNSYGDEHKLFGIVNTNGYQMNFEETDKILTYLAVGNKGSRINHSCTPNLCVDFDIATFTLQYAATRDIKVGEQLFYSYCNPMQPVKQRQEALGRYKFVCRCTACENATPESDRVRVRYGTDLTKVSREWEMVLMGAEFKASELKSLLEMEKEVMKEGLDFWLPFLLLLDAIAKVYTKLGDRKKADEYKERLQRYKPAFLDAV